MVANITDIRRWTTPGAANQKGGGGQGGSTRLQQDKAGAALEHISYLYQHQYLKLFWLTLTESETSSRVSQNEIFLILFCAA